jgi:hypothetical protein
MTARLETIVRQKQLERDAVDLVTARYPSTQAGAVNGMIVLRTVDHVLCIDLKASAAPLTQHRLNEHARLRRKGFKVLTARSAFEVQMALPRASVAS